MAEDIAHHDQFTIVGIYSRTTNAIEMSGAGIIGSQWKRFMSEGLLAQIPHRADDNIIAFYTDYENDMNGKYSFVIGARVTEIGSLPEGMHPFDVPDGKYAKFTSGAATADIVGTWMRIWSTSPEELGGSRAYIADYELFDKHAHDPNTATVDIYVGLS